MRLPPVVGRICFFADVSVLEAIVPAVAAINARVAAVVTFTRARVDGVLTAALIRARAVHVGRTRARTFSRLIAHTGSNVLVPASTQARPP